MSDAQTAELPLFPLQTVLFPGGRLPLRIFETRYMDMAKACLRDSTPFGVCLIREGVEVGEPALPEAVGCVARIAQWDMPQLGLLHVLALGERRFRIRERRVQPDGLARADVTLLAPETDAALDPGSDLCARVLRRAIESSPEPIVEPPLRYDSAAWVSARLAELLPLSNETRQALLEMDDAGERAARLRRLISAAT